MACYCEAEPLAGHFLFLSPSYFENEIRNSLENDVDDDFEFCIEFDWMWFIEIKNYAIARKEEKRR